MNPTRHNYIPMTVTGENPYSSRMNSTRYTYTQMTVTGANQYCLGKDIFHVADMA